MGPSECEALPYIDMIVGADLDPGEPPIGVAPVTTRFS